MKRKTAVLVDVDGTLCDVRPVRHHVMNKPKDFHAFHEAALECPPNPEVIDYCKQQHAEGHKIVVWTARKEQWRKGTFEWLTRNVPCHFEGPVMREDKDNRPDTEVKRQMFGWLSRTYDIVGAIDDNPRIIDLLENELGVPTQVVEGWDHEAAATYTELANKMDPVP